ncbi:MAG: hypothetical protein HYW48_10895 [Deltaproteobacteria bacterium]|nr:hypothetical protein [Deltaproteobacteria bacterium]
MLPTLKTLNGSVASYQDVKQAISKDLFGKKAVGDTLIFQKLNGKAILELFDSGTGSSTTATMPIEDTESIEKAIKQSPSSLYLGFPSSQHSSEVPSEK